jgi:hypothetical protein
MPTPSKCRRLKWRTKGLKNIRQMQEKSTEKLRILKVARNWERKQKNFENFAFFKSPKTGNASKKTLKVSHFQSRPKTKTAKKRRTFANLSEKTSKFLRIIAEKNCEKTSKFWRIIAENNCEKVSKNCEKSSKISANYCEKKR